MTSRIILSLVVCSALVSSAAAQTVRFETTEGNFDMVLNPNHLDALQGHVDNMLRYIEDNRYLGSWINRADTGFVLQMGGFFSHTKRPGVSQDFLHGVQQYNDIVEGEPAMETGLSNTTGTVALALSGNAGGGTNQDSGSSSFFVNVADTNTFLDSDFTVFAAIPDMTTINKIMALTTQDLATQLGADAGNLAFAKVPVNADDKQVFIKRAFVITDTLESARALAGIQSVLQNSAAAAASSLMAEMPPFTSSAALASGSSSVAAASSGLAIVPEPASAALAVFAMLSFFGLRRSR